MSSTLQNKKKFCGHLSCKIQRSMTSRKWQLSWNLKWSCDLAQLRCFSFLLFFFFLRRSKYKSTPSFTSLRRFTGLPTLLISEIDHWGMTMILEKFVGFWAWKRNFAIRGKRAKLFEKVNYSCLMKLEKVGDTIFLCVGWGEW